MERIIYKCKKCNWEKSVHKNWADLRPKLCGNKKSCKTLFNIEPDKLEIIFPSTLEVKQEQTEKKYRRNKKDGDSDV